MAEISDPAPRATARLRATALRVWLRSLQRVANSAGRSPEVWLPAAAAWLAVRLAERRGLLPHPQEQGLLARDCIARGRAAPSLRGARLFDFEFDEQLELQAKVACVRKCSRDLEALLDLDQSADVLGLAYEQLFGWINVGQLRRNRGSFFTPRGICDVLVARSLADSPALGRPLRVCDPAVGGGAFLLACYRHLVGEGPDCSADRLAALESLWGADISSRALSIAELSLWLEAGMPELAVADMPCHLIHVDSLLSKPASAGGEPGGLETVVGALLAEGGFDLVVGNPPWVAFAGRAAQPIHAATREAYSKHYRAWRGYPTLHGLFVELAVKLAPRGRVALLLPSPVADLQGYAAVREVATATHRLLMPLPELGQDAFNGVTQPSFGLLLEACEGAEASRQPWGLEERTKTRSVGREVSVPDVLTQLIKLPSLPAGCFGERGFQSTGEISRNLFLRGNVSVGHSVGLLEGRDVREFYLGPTRLFLNPDPVVLSRCRSKLRSAECYQEVDFVVRQTASHPIAALHDGRTFRNSLLAGFASEDYSAALLVGLLNSTLYRALHIAGNRDARQRVFPQVKIRHLRSLPAPPAHAVLRQCVAELASEASVGRASAVASAQLPAAQRAALDAAVFELFGLTPNAAAEVTAFVRQLVPRALPLE